LKVNNEIAYNAIPLKDELKYLFLGIIICALLLIMFFIVQNESFIYALFVLSVITVLTFNFEITYGLLIGTIFISFFLLGQQIGVLFSFFVFLSFLITHYNINQENLKNPLTIFFIIYIISVVPSLSNISNPFLTFIRSLSFISILLLWYISSIAINNSDKIKKIFYIYASFLILSSFYVIYLAITTGERVFGLADVFFADLAGIGLFIFIVNLLCRQRRALRIYNFVLLIIALAALFFTQTRNSWLAFALALLIFIIFLIIKSAKLNLNRRKLIIYFASFLVVFIAIYFMSTIINPSIESRAENTAEKTVLTKAPESVGSNSLIMRAFIWHTAIQAFEKHPIEGIGFYSFPIESKYYYEIPKVFYKAFVEGKTAHSGYLALIAETGILGLLGFLTLLIAAIRISLLSVKLSGTINEIINSLIILAFFIYITISLIMTSAWLWGQQGILFGILLGITCSNYKMLSKKSV